MSSPPAVSAPTHSCLCVVADQFSRMLEETHPSMRQSRGDDREEAKVSSMR